jgi:EAL domain-containing protein (putative c-di-GMP-specific phosphodiesterase class I)
MLKKCTGCREDRGLPFAIRTAFQPIVDLRTGNVHAYEALVRGPDGEGAAWVLDQVTDDNRYAFDQACRVTAIREAVAAGILDTGARLSINFLPNAVYSPLACIQLTLKTAKEFGFPIDRLTFEFTENERVDPDHLRGIVDTYRAIGFRTALDDFGAGHSGLALLANLQTDVIKLDKELISGMDASMPRRMIVTAVARLAHDMGIEVVAEGIETTSEMAAVQAVGIRYAQGYLFARPQLGQLVTPALAPTARRAAA